MWRRIAWASARSRKRGSRNLQTFVTATKTEFHGTRSHLVPLTDSEEPKLEASKETGRARQGIHPDSWMDFDGFLHLAPRRHEPAQNRIPF